MMNLKELKEMIQLMNEHQLVELEIEREGMRIRLRKGVSGAIEVAASPETGLPPGILPQPAGAGGPLLNPPPTGSIAARPGTKLVEIKAPMVGTFYAAPAPDAQPFVTVGAEIEVGQVLCIIEAMKLMNEIKSEVKGKIVQILVDNGEPVQFGQALFQIEPT